MKHTTKQQMTYNTINCEFNNDIIYITNELNCIDDLTNNDIKYLMNDTYKFNAQNFNYLFNDNKYDLIINARTKHIKNLQQLFNNNDLFKIIYDYTSISSFEIVNLSYDDFIKLIIDTIIENNLICFDAMQIINLTNDYNNKLLLILNHDIFDFDYLIDEIKSNDDVIELLNDNKLFM